MKGLRKAAVLLVLLAVWLTIPAAMADKTITMTFTGDVTLGGENYLQGRDYSFSGYAARFGYDYFFRNVAGLFREDDVTVINLEGTLTDSSAQENTGKTYRFRAPRDFVKILTGSSVEACCITNNHVWDFGNQGFRSTHETLDEAQIGYFGVREVYVHEQDGIRIGFLALYSSEYSSNKQWCIDKIAALKASGVNAVVFCFHMGTEYSPVHHESQERLANFAVDAGADLVIMHHPHVVQGIDIIKNRTVFYSLGNFCFGGNCKVRALESMLVQAQFVFSDTGAYKGQRFAVYPAHISGTDPESNFQPVLVRGEDAANVLQLIQFDTKFQLPDFDEERGSMLLPFLPAHAGSMTVVDDDPGFGWAPEQPAPWRP